MSWSRWRQVVLNMGDLEAITHNLSIVREKIIKVSESRSPVSFWICWGSCNRLLVLVVLSLYIII